MTSTYELNSAIQALRKECEDALGLIRAQRQLLEAARATIAQQAERISELEANQKEPLDAKPSE